MHRALGHAEMGGALPAKLFLIKPMYFNALKSGGAMILYHQKYTLASRFLMRQTQKPGLTRLVWLLTKLHLSYIFHYHVGSPNLFNQWLEVRIAAFDCK
jgi:hypothetical protein